jgi:hypothetical protein
VLINAIGPPCQSATTWHAREPALALVPSFQVTGMLAMVVASAVLIWSAAVVQRDHGGVVLLLVTLLLFLVGGGFYTVFYGIVAGIAGAKIGAPLGPRPLRHREQAALPRDVVYDEDRSTVRTASTPRIMATQRSTASGLLRLTGTDDIAKTTRHHARDPRPAKRTLTC